MQGSYIDAFRFEDCIECGECLNSCVYMDLNRDESIEGIQKLRQGNGFDTYLDKCIYCGQCNKYCEADARPAALLLERLRDRRKAEESVPGFFAYYLNGMEELGCAENYFKDIYLASSEETRKTIDEWSEPKQGDDLLWCGCGNRINPQNIENSRVLSGLPKFGGVGDCCGVNAVKTGLFDTVKHVTNNLIEKLYKSKFKRLVVSCGSCQEHFNIFWPEYFGDKFPFEVISLYEYIDEQMAKGKFSVQREVDLDVAISDACYGHMFGEKYLKTVKRLYEAVGITAVPLEHHGENTACCGVAGYARNFKVDDIFEVMKAKVKDIEKSGKKEVLNYCMGCHTITTMLYPVKSHYLLDKILWALGDDMVSSIHIPKPARKKAELKFKDTATFRLQII